MITPHLQEINLERSMFHVGASLIRLRNSVKKSKKTHGDNKHAQVYLAAANLAELQIDTTPIEDEPKEG